MKQAASSLEGELETSAGQIDGLLARALDVGAKKARIEDLLATVKNALATLERDLDLSASRLEALPWDREQRAAYPLRLPVLQQ